MTTLVLLALVAVDDDVVAVQAGVILSEAHDVVAGASDVGVYVLLGGVLDLVSPQRAAYKSSASVMSAFEVARH